MKRLIWTVLVAGMLVGCGTDDSDPTNASNTNTANTTPENNTNAGNSTTPNEIEQSFAVSECGGFSNKRGDWQTFSEADYCDAEVLAWSYDQSTGELTLSNERVVLNCCGEHDIKVTKQSDGSYLISETDAPDSNGGRCHCICVFDFEVTVKIPEGTIDIKLEREVTDSDDGVQEIFSGQLDLSAGSGVEIVDTTDASPWCETEEPEPEQVSHSPEISECGGLASNSNALDYCDAEVLAWSYDAEAQQLELANNRVELNCCGEHSIEVTQSADGKYMVAEIDEPLDEGRCYCLCVYDFVTVIDGVSGDEAAITVTRQVSDGSTATATIVFDGTLDLTAGSGTEIISTDAASGCN